MHVLKRAVRTATAAVAVAGVVVAGAGPAAANDFTLGVIGDLGGITVQYADDGSGFRICVSGRIPNSTRMSGSWNLVIQGTRVIGNSIDYRREWFGYDVPTECVIIDKEGTPSGSFNVEWAYVAAGSYVYSGSNAVVGWDLRTGDYHLIAPS